MKNTIPEEVLKEIFKKKLKRRDLNGKVYHEMKKMILSGKLRDGERLVQETLSHYFDVSRTVILHALVQLQKDKLIIRKPKKGAFVSLKH